MGWVVVGGWRVHYMDGWVMGWVVGGFMVWVVVGWMLGGFMNWVVCGGLGGGWVHDGVGGWRVHGVGAYIHPSMNNYNVKRFNFMDTHPPIKHIQSVTLLLYIYSPTHEQL